MPRGNKPVCLLLCLWPVALAAQTSGGDIARIVERLDRLEEENRAQAREIAELRAQLDIQERRVDEQAQSKVEASAEVPHSTDRHGAVQYLSRFPPADNGADYPTVAAPQPGARQPAPPCGKPRWAWSFTAPKIFWDGDGSRLGLHGFFCRRRASLGQTFRLRTGSVEIDWKTPACWSGQEKPIFNPREPSSLAQVAFRRSPAPATSGCGCPRSGWSRIIAFGAVSGLRARMGVVETHESTLTTRRPLPALWRHRGRPWKAFRIFLQSGRQPAAGIRARLSRQRHARDGLSIPSAICSRSTGFSTPGGSWNLRGVLLRSECCESGNRADRPGYTRSTGGMRYHREPRRMGTVDAARGQPRRFAFVYRADGR